MIPKLTLSRFKDDTRGQILLLAAVAIVLLVFSMVTILNTAAFTEQERSTGVDTRSVDVVHHLEQTEYSMEIAVRHANHDPDETDQSTRTTRLIGNNGEFELLEQRLAERFASEGVNVIVHSDTATVTDGVRIWQSEYNELITTETDPGPTPPGDPPAELPQGTYGVVTGADNMRSFTIMATGEELEQPGSGNEFEVEFANHDDVFIYENPSDSSELIVSDTSSSGGQEYAVTVSTSEPARIAFTHGKLNDRKIPILPGTEDIESVTIKNGGNISAAFDMVVTGQDSIGFVQDNANKNVQDSPDDEADELQAHDAVYSVTVEVTVQTPGSDLTTVVRVTPQLPGYADTGA